ncbi:unnamed protein product [Didymodactylos carnosus]|uniref:Uncharacterized protein n=1 Tax=Didymodactylos carnosus TaxID=1234261 RepID=A0A8S2F5A1_9BILA|nr:unnamed protein product [Didymodactylos carnosus]CAF4156414.1 unnamed protein product [Didymodactylos carnosus]
MKKFLINGTHPWQDVNQGCKHTLSVARHHRSDIQYTRTNMSQFQFDHSILFSTPQSMGGFVRRAMKRQNENKENITGEDDYIEEKKPRLLDDDENLLSSSSWPTPSMDDSTEVYSSFDEQNASYLCRTPLGRIVNNQARHAWHPRDTDGLESRHYNLSSVKRRNRRGVYPSTRVRNGVTREIIEYSSTLGSYGSGPSSFKEPNGLAVFSNGFIAVVDTNSHTVKIFDSFGHYHSSFGHPGKNEGDLLYPYRCAVMPHTDDLVVVQRRPKPQIQIFTSDGIFKTRFGEHLREPRAFSIDSLQQILVIESKVMTLHIFDGNNDGRVLGCYNLRQHLQFPTGICSNVDKNEIFISDNQLHCVQIVSYQGQYLRCLRDQNFILYPICLKLNSKSHLIVVDNHHGLNMTVYDENQQRIGAFSSRTCHAQILDATLGMNDTMFVATRDYRVYQYELPC